MSTSISFDEEYFSQMLAARRHPWVIGMLDLGADMVGTLDRDARVLDAGCGSGAALPWLHRATDDLVAAFDWAESALTFCRRADPCQVLARASVEHLPYRDETFDLVTSADVLQHVPVDVARRAVEEVARVLAPGGRFLVRTNAAFGRAELTERDDWHLYRAERLRNELESAGLTVERLTHANAFPALAATARNRLARIARSSRQPEHHAPDHAAPEHDRTGEHHVGIGIPAPSTGLRRAVLAASLGAERRYLRRPGASLPWGHTLIAVAQRPPR